MCAGEARGYIEVKIEAKVRVRNVEIKSELARVESNVNSMLLKSMHRSFGALGLRFRIFLQIVEPWSAHSDQSPLMCHGAGARTLSMMYGRS